MAACCGKSKSDNCEQDLEDDTERSKFILPDNTLPLSSVHGILSRLSQEGVSDPDASPEKPKYGSPE